jgi:hypothetical protein
LVGPEGSGRWARVELEDGVKGHGPGQSGLVGLMTFGLAVYQGVCS